VFFHALEESVSEMIVIKWYYISRNQRLPVLERFQNNDSIQLYSYQLSHPN